MRFHFGERWFLWGGEFELRSEGSQLANPVDIWAELPKKGKEHGKGYEAGADFIDQRSITGPVMNEEEEVRTRG